jgi:hypothetical protein
LYRQGFNQGVAVDVSEPFANRLAGALEHELDDRMTRQDGIGAIRPGGAQGIPPRPVGSTSALFEVHPSHQLHEDAGGLLVSPYQVIGNGPFDEEPSAPIGAKAPPNRGRGHPRKP